MLPARITVLLLLLAAGLTQPATAQTHHQTGKFNPLTLQQLGEIEVATGVTSIVDALRLIPGVNVARVNGSRHRAVGIRGFGDQRSKYVLVLIDGHSVYTPFSSKSSSVSTQSSFGAIEYWSSARR